MYLRTLLALAAALSAIGLSGCEGPSAPDQPGVCWRRMDQGGKPRFVRLADHIANLEDCAVLLEALRLQGQGNTDGAYQGYFIYVGPDAIRSSSNANHLGYPVFQPPQRDAIDRDLRRLIKERGGQMPRAGDITVERR